MKTVKLKSRNRDLVIMLQEILNEAGYTLVIDGVFGPKTDEAVKDYQEKNDLVEDGIVGPKTWTKLFSQFPEYNIQKSSMFLSEKDLKDVSRELGIELAAMKAVNEVESMGLGFIAGKPKILFEGHIFWKRLRVHGIDPEECREGNDDVLYSRWTSRNYIGGVAEHKRLAKAKKIHVAAALESASWGLFQIMGFHWKSLGYKSVQQFVQKMEKNEREHLVAFAKFIKFHKLDGYLKDHDWAQFARKYNGPGYKKNRYDEKLKKAYEKYADNQ